LFTVLFVGTMAASAAYDDGGDCGNDYWWLLLHHLPVPPRPDPWYSIDQVTKINSGVITNPGVITSSGAQVNSVIQM